MSHNKPAFAITLDGQDITSKIYPRLVSLTLTEARENAVDELNITIDDSDGRVAIPRKGVKITLQLGWHGSPMVDKGTLQFTLALGRPDITPMMGVRIPSLKTPIGDTDWIIVKTTHSVTAQGFTTQLEMETRKGQEQKEAGTVEESEQ